MNASLLYFCLFLSSLIVMDDHIIVSLGYIRPAGRFRSPVASAVCVERFTRFIPLAEPRILRGYRSHRLVFWRSSCRP
ncbi:hypothetical protein P170DRAFT_65457 [Aspergillus steynii IBT 23096]|uniref:Secreted protein n=1 Tax=Aspergillus steynii IBT 23096 TaxID=1392250 RepID=A0A2I2FTH3_9EURO|nr:uncharacterized protein P170DRAFT_65457 [Aspergillus steynii IBT 23096]PLB43922.1 hypothetical protein P170DRAFT_65457 [Aspergillus steynii IBT 23096]